MPRFGHAGVVQGRELAATLASPVVGSTGLSLACVADIWKHQTLDISPHLDLAKQFSGVARVAAEQDPARGVAV